MRLPTDILARGEVEGISLEVALLAENPGGAFVEAFFDFGEVGAEGCFDCDAGVGVSCLTPCASM